MLSKFDRITGYRPHAARAIADRRRCYPRSPERARPELIDDRNLQGGSKPIPNRGMTVSKTETAAPMVVTAWHICINCRRPTNNLQKALIQAAHIFLGKNEKVARRRSCHVAYFRVIALC